MKAIKSKIAEKNTEILIMLKKIENSLHEADDSKNWGHVGETKHVEECLSEICDFFCGE